MEIVLLVFGEGGRDEMGYVGKGLRLGSGQTGIRSALQGYIDI